MAVQQLRDTVNTLAAEAGDGGSGDGHQLTSIQLDWWLWGQGERLRHQHPPHHRTWTIYY